MARQRAEQRKPEDTQGQDAIFRGTSGGDAKLKDEAFKDQRSVRGTPNAALPAFVLGEELADLADRDPRIVVLTADLANANRTNDFRARHPGPLLQSRHRREEHDDDRRRHGVLRHGRLCRDLRLLLRHPGRRAGQDRLRLSRHEGAPDRPSFRHVDGLLRHQPPCAGGPGDHPHHRRPDGDLRHRRQSSARDPARLGRSSRRHVYPPRPRPRSRRSIRRCRRDFRIGKAATLRKGKDLAIITCGSMVRAIARRRRAAGEAGHRGAGHRHAHDQAARCRRHPQGRARDRRPS